MRLGRKKGYIYLQRANGRRHGVGWVPVAVFAVLSLLAFLVLLLVAQQRMILTAAPPSAPAEGSVRPPTAGNGASSAANYDALVREQAIRKRAALSSASEETCDDALVLVDRSHALPKGYVPENLVSLPANGVPTLGGREMLLRREAAEHLRGLVSAAAADGQELVVASAFRSYEDQQLSYGRLRSIYGAGADAMSATPGHSQHQLGTAVDFTNAAVGYQVKRRFGFTSASEWLAEHAPEHGFVLAYPPGGDESGYQWEPWHYRYIGVQNAERFEQSGLSLEGFLVREGVRPDC